MIFFYLFNTKHSNVVFNNLSVLNIMPLDWDLFSFLCIFVYFHLKKKLKKFFKIPFSSWALINGTTGKYVHSLS